ncbi:hypothetical protein QN391_25330 [Pseudomonas sp. CCI1.2]|uniref:hypothetical protein n=1 Tax=Pseudomonas sp. CCI1.2 TaxID=3048614 RepID=UPI002B23E3D8|nr:hypothetical protein [Pseudomonas sp. CCI1.2]MEB0123976.1 hypothetical protein [Pseudomonas sp. CCI1.2]
MSIEGKSLRGMTFLAFLPLVVLFVGCSTTGSKSFTLKTNLPADFKVTADVYYSPATNATCVMPPTTSSYIPGRKRLKSEVQDIEHSVEFEIPLSDSAGGCPLVLRSVRLDIQGRWGPDADDVSSDIAGLSFLDQSDKINKLYNGECQWFFRTAGPNRYLIKVIKCLAVDEQGVALKQPAGGVLQRDSLINTIVNVTFKVAAEDSPYYNRSWMKTSVGWKPCTGRWGSNNEELCISPPKFTDYRMSEKTCTVYPSCTELEIKNVSKK